MFCGADFTCLHELVFLKNHSHPTVALFAENLLQGKPIEYDGNPLIDFNSMRFFDRFIYKNPKKQIAKHEQLRQKSRHAAGHLYLPKGVKAVPVDSKEYTKLNPSNIPADEKFLYTFMKMRQETSEEAQTRKKTKSIDDEIDDNESIESVSDDEFDKYLDHFMGDVDKDEIDLDEDDIASNVQRTRPLKNDDDDDEISDDEVIDTPDVGTKKTEHIRENFKVDNEREMKQIKWELDREQIHAKRSKRYEKHLKKTSRRKPKLTRREKRRQLHEMNEKKTKKTKKSVRFG